MSKLTRDRLKLRVLRSILVGKFETFDYVLFTSALFHGLWLVLNHFEVTPPSIVWEIESFQSAALALGVAMTFTGAGGLLALVFGKPKIRANLDLAQFVQWLFLSISMAIIGQVPPPFWVGYLTIALMSGVVRLNSSTGLGND